MAFLPRCRTDEAFVITYFFNEAGLVDILRSEAYPLGIRLAVAPLVNMEEQIVTMLLENAKTKLQREDISVCGDFFEPSRDVYSKPATFYLARSRVEIIWQDDRYYAENFVAAIRNAPATRERATYLKALQIMSGMHSELIKAVEESLVIPKPNI